MTIYTDPDAIAAILGRTLTAAEEARATDAAVAASDFIEHALDRSWLDADPENGTEVADEQHVVVGCQLWLDHRPVLAITEISTRLRYAGATTYELTYPYQYELVTPAVGEVYLSPTYEGQLITVTYTSTERPPRIVREFAGQLAAGMLALSLVDDSSQVAAAAGIKSYALWGGDLRVEFAEIARDGSSPLGSRLPAMWLQIETLFSRKPVVV